MSIRSALTTALSFAVVCTGLQADTIRVPADFARLQDAIDAAAPGDVILIDDVPDLQNEFGPPVVVDKPLSLIGNPTFSLEPLTCASPWVAGAKGILWLEGPGSGSVTIAGYRSIGGIDCAYPPPAIGGGGFASLQLYDCALHAIAGSLTGSGHAGHGIDVDVGTLLLEHCTATGGQNTEGSPCFAPDSDGGAAVRAPNSTVIAIGCTFTGGNVLSGSCCFCGCPADLSEVTGHGGPGVVAKVLYDSQSIINGGDGATFRAYLQSQHSQSIVCGELPDGPALVVEDHVGLSGQLLVNGSPDGLAHIGQSFPVIWGLQTFMALYVSPGGGTPTPTAHGLTFLDLSALFSIGLFTPDITTVSLPVPADPGLIGVDLTLQAFDAGYGNGLTIPVFTAIVP